MQPETAATPDTNLTLTLRARTPYEFLINATIRIIAPLDNSLVHNFTLRI